ncbi:MAG: MFS transporter [Methanoregula sp.]|jgi:EmrB/QacA subfamily drug resistance transporter|uniref:MFS transporter n=1 Tax=Methanoregula sp. TaxID=2052170 RepID=UPI0025E5F272|nr:MFS transporter [Methanoregula sp.]MCK9631424.1 MFS transporter [Methanoregula sp.]
MNSNNHAVSTGLILFVVGIGAFMDGLDGAIVNVSLPQIAASFNADISLASLVLTIYLVVLSSLMVIFAKISTFAGTKKIYIGGLAIFTLASLLCAVSWNIEALIAFRAFQGLGAAMIAPSAVATIALHVRESERAKSLGVIAAASALAFALGPVAGGLITEYLSWHWIFLINLPIGIIAIVLAHSILADDAPPIAAPRAFDYPGAVLFFIAMTLFILPMGFIGERSEGLITPVNLLFLSAVVFLLFALAEKKAMDPVIDLSLFLNRNFTCSTLSYSFAMLAYGGLLLILPFYLQFIMSMSPGEAGLFLLIPSIIITVLSPVGGMLADKTGAGKVCVVSSVVFLVTFLMMLFLSSNSGTGLLIVALIIMGIGFGPFMSAGSSRIIEHSGEDKREMASGIMSTSIYFGTALGTALFTAIFSYFSGDHGSQAGLPVPAFMSGFNAAIVAGVLFCIIVIVSSSMVRDTKRT